MANSNQQTNALGLSSSATLFILFFVIAVAGVSVLALRFGLKPDDIAVMGFIAFSIIILAFAAAVLWQIGKGEIKLVGLISEPAGPNDKGDVGKASLSRFQFLIFTFVVAGLFLMLCIETGSFVEIPGNVLGLIGISGGSFIVSKAVGQNDPKNKPAAPDAPHEDGD